MYKRSIRDSIIHIPDNKDVERITSDRVMYNGRVTGIAFVNQEKLTEMELDNYRKKATINSSAGQSFAGDKKNSELSSFSSEKHNSSAFSKENAKSASNHTSSKTNSAKSNKLAKIILIIIFVTVLIAAIVYYFFIL